MAPDHLTSNLQTKQHDYRVQIRRANVGDASAISNVLEQAFSEYRTLYTSQGYTTTAIAADEVIKRMSEGPMWVALFDERVAGTVAAVAKRDSLYVRGMGIVPSARGKRIGEKLLEHVQKFAVDGGHKRLTLSTTPFLHRAIRLYENFGFRRVAGESSDLHGTPLFSMYKNL